MSTALVIASGADTVEHARLLTDDVLQVLLAWS